jgi:hypothetical protein
MGYRSQKGIAIFELVLVLPILFLFSFGTFEFARFLRQMQFASFLSRELARVGYQECASDHSAVNSDSFDPQVCLEMVVRELNQRTESVLPGAELILSIYNLDSMTVTRDGIGGEGEQKSKISLAIASDKQTDIGKMLSEYETVVIGEVYLPHIVFVRYIPGMVQFEERFV